MEGDVRKVFGFSREYLVTFVTVVFACGVAWTRLNSLDASVSDLKAGLVEIKSGTAIAETGFKMDLEQLGKRVDAQRADLNSMEGKLLILETKMEDLRNTEKQRSRSNSNG